MAKDTINQLTDIVKAGFAKLEAQMEKGFAAVAKDVEELRTELKGDIFNLGEQLTNMEAEIKPVT
jgi:glutathionyl-hydroquinone reductase